MLNPLIEQVVVAPTNRFTNTGPQSFSEIQNSVVSQVLEKTISWAVRLTVAHTSKASVVKNFMG